MILSRFCRSFPHPDDNETLILYSTKNGAKIALPKSLFHRIEDDLLSSEDEKCLADLGFLVQDENTDDKQLLSFVEEVNAVSPFSFFKIVMNLDCNLACSYCFEGSRKGKHYLPEEFDAQLIAFIKAYTSGSREIRVTFYGGEPLLSIKRIASLSESLQAFAAGEELRLWASLITNGTLLTPRVAERLYGLGVRAVSITLDGPEGIHDQSRPFRNGRGSYRRIMDNLKAMRGLMDVALGGNYTRKNYMRFPELLDDLAAQGFKPEDFASVQFNPVIQETGGVVEHGYCDGYGSINEPWVFDAQIYLREEILKRGYKQSKIVPLVCMMELQGRYVINYDGSLYKCAGFIGREEYKVGDIWTGVREYSSLLHLDNWKNEKCLNCSYLPLCFGGCRYMKFVRDGSMEGVDCQKPYFDATLEAMVRQDIKYGLA